MRTTTNKRLELCHVSGRFTLTLDDRMAGDATLPSVMVRLNDFIRSMPWRDENRVVEEKIETPTRTEHELLFFQTTLLVRPVLCLHNGQIKAYENRLKEMGRSIKIFLRHFPDAKVRIEMRTAKGIEI